MGSQTPDQLHLPQPPGRPDPGPDGATAGHEPTRENWLKLIGLVLLHDVAVLLLVAVAVVVGAGVLAAVFESAPVVAFFETFDAFVENLKRSLDK